MTVALTRILHGEPGEKDLREIAEGAPVKEDDFSEEDWAVLVAAGAVGEPVVAPADVIDENEALKKQIAALKAQLAAKVKAEAPTK
jgi:hypothetical protein